jgi:protein-S-isoprenylcysteine O-methyltransferase Ste14
VSATTTGGPDASDAAVRHGDMLAACRERSATDRMRLLPATQDDPDRRHPTRHGRRHSQVDRGRAQRWQRRGRYRHRTGEEDAMEKRAAALGTALFFALAPGTVAGVVPWWLTRWRTGSAVLPGWSGALERAGGAILIAAGAAVLVHAFARFVVEGRGTPAPPAPTARLVVGGLYRHVRNPMYLAVVAAIVGQGLLLGQPVLFAYAAIVAAAVAAFVHAYEQPTLSRRFGAEYAEYRRNVPAWWPRLRPWRPRS